MLHEGMTVAYAGSQPVLKGLSVILYVARVRELAADVLALISHSRQKGETTLIMPLFMIYA